MGKTYQDVLLAIRNGAEADDVETMISDEHSALTDSQMADLRDELAQREAQEQG